MPIIDAHLHYAGDTPDVLNWLADNDVKFLNIAISGHGDKWLLPREPYRDLAQQYPDRYAWCTSIPLPGFNDPQYADKVIAQLEGDFANGAVAFKIWKAFGMEAKNLEGQFIQMDDPIFHPIYQWMSDNNHPILVHIAEPMGCWQPLGPDNAYSEYYRKAPEWYMYGRTDYPHHSEMIAARDHVLEQFGELQLIGAHLGSLEFDVAELAKRFEKYPNFAVDTSGPARITDLGRQDRQTVRGFLIKYADRIMYGSDRVTWGNLCEMSEADRKASWENFLETFELGRDFYCTDKPITLKGFEFTGLALPDDVQEKIFHSTAKRWYPGL